MSKSPIFGIVQGRLTQAPPDQLQWFPQENWEEEFTTASTIGLNYIELIVERDHNPKNPIWDNDGIKKIKTLITNNHLFSHALCNDYVIEHCLISDMSVIGQTIDVISRGSLLEVDKLILPMFEQSELRKSNYKNYKNVLTEIGDASHENNMILCIESILNGEELLYVLEDLNHPNIYCVFDTGNRIAFGHDIYKDIILLGDYIKHVHIKDKNDNNENVLLGTGNVNFLEVLKSLSTINYKGPYTFETARGRNSIETAKFNIAFTKYFINETAEN